MYEHYQHILNEKGLKSSDVCKATGIVASTFSDWKKGKSVPKHDKMVKIANFLGVTEQYLRTGNDAGLDEEAQKTMDLISTNIKDYQHQRIQKYADEFEFFSCNLTNEHMQELIRYGNYLYTKQQEEEENLLRAAHMNEDATPEQIKHDDDIMNDDDEWK